MTFVQKTFYGAILILCLATTTLAVSGQYAAEKRMAVVYAILTK